MWKEGMNEWWMTGGGHHSQLTTTATLFLPDSRARMRDRVQEDKEKNKTEK